MALTIDQRIARIEKATGCTVPGTQIMRSLPDTGLEWSIGIGQMMMPKRFFSGKTIAAAIREAELSLKLQDGEIPDWCPPHAAQGGLMDFKEFFDLAREIGGLEFPKASRKGLHQTKDSYRQWETDHMSEAFIGETWRTGGMGGGSCWDTGEDDHHHSITGDLEPAMTSLDELLLKVAPNISFLLYLKMESTLLKRGEYSEHEYYGNHTDYAYKRIVLLELFDFLRGNDVI